MPYYFTSYAAIKYDCHAIRVITLRACARGKAIGSVRLSVTTKIAIIASGNRRQTLKNVPSLLEIRSQLA